MPRERKQNLKRRRQLIFRRVVLDNRPLSIEELGTLLNDKTYNKDKAERDAEEFQAVGCSVALRLCAGKKGEAGEKEFVFLEGSHTDDDTVRENINRDGKHLVARLAATVICGLPDHNHEATLLPSWMTDPYAQRALAAIDLAGIQEKSLASRVRSVLLHLEEKLKPQQGKFHLDSTEKVIKLLEQSTMALDSRQKLLRANLRGFWGEANRLVAIDSGTTNRILATYLRELPLPVPGSALCSLAICTNSRKIFEELGPPEVGVKCIIIGGQQKFHSPTIAGAMAELFLKTASILQFGICILGSTKVDVERFVVCSDSQEEASMKTLFMEKSSMRIICVDDSKLQTGPGREGYKFASIDPKHIDLIITNSPFRSKKVSQEHFVAFRTKVRAIEGRGVPVLVATSSETFGHPNEEQDVPPEISGLNQKSETATGA